MRRIVVFLGLAAVMATLTAGPAAAQAEVTREVFKGSVSEGVTGFFWCGESTEELQTSYDYKGFYQTITKPNGGQTYMIHSVTRGQEVSASGETFFLHSGGNEIYQIEKVAVVSEDGEEVIEPTVWRHAHLTVNQFQISRGPQDNSYIQGLVHVEDPNVTDEESHWVDGIVKERMGCRG